MSKVPYRNIIIFDTETTGLIPKKETSLEKFPYITQLSFIVYDTHSESIKSTFDAYIKIPKGIEIPQIVTELTGITNEKCENEGIPIQQALGVFYHAMTLCDCVIGHNIDFDIQMMNIEIRRNIEFLKLFPDIYFMFDPLRLLEVSIKTDCTMRMSTEACSLYRTNERNRTYKKFPKLVETYFHLFQKVPENLHNSIVDSLICLRCYLKMRFDINMEEDKFLELVNHYAF